MRYDFNILEEYAQDFLSAGYPEKATKIYLFMADQSSGGGHLGKKLGECYERLGDLHAAKYWYGRAVEENPQARLDCVEARERLAHVTLDELIPADLYVR